MRTLYLHILLIALFFSVGKIRAQKNSVDFSHAYFVKQKVVAIRILPAGLKTFEAYKNQTIIVKKFKLQGDQKIEQGKPFLLHPFAVTDTGRWMAFFRKESDRAALFYQYLRPAEEQKKVKLPNQTPNAEQQLYNLLMLNCDYSSSAAESFGLMYRDSLIDNQSVYVYNFTLSGNNQTKFLFEQKIDSKLLTQQPEIKNLSAKLKKKIVTCKLDVSAYKKAYSAYFVEKSADNTIFYKTSVVPYVYLEYEQMKEKNILTIDDSVQFNEPTVYYRIKGVNIFGEESEPSNVVTLKNYQDIRSYPNIDTLRTILNKMVFLKWNMQDAKETPFIKNFILARAPKDSGPYTNLYQSKLVLQYTDKEPLANNFYKVMAITEYDDTLQSFSRMIYLNDTTAPLPPKNLKATVDKKGNVTVTWSKSSESDLRGYRVFKANGLNEEFVSPNEKFLTDTVFKETLPMNNLAHFIYYSAVASDINFNSSKQCAPFKLRRPDTIAPVKPIISDVKLLQQAVKLFFNPSKSEDLAAHVLKRSSTKDTSQKTLLRFLANDTLTKFFLDTSAVLGESYNYTLIAYDEDNNKANSLPRYVNFETGFRPNIKDLKAEVDLEKRKINLSWQGSVKEVDKYILYRASESEPYTIITTLEPNTSSFVDKDLNIGNTYFYKIKAVYKNGAESIFNQPLKVIY